MPQSTHVTLPLTARPFGCILLAMHGRFCIGTVATVIIIIVIASCHLNNMLVVFTDDLLIGIDQRRPVRWTQRVCAVADTTTFTVLGGMCIGVL
jgi:hypothetical protein